MLSFPLALQLLLGATPPAVAPAAPPCEVTGDVSAAADVLRAEQACAVARARFAELFGEPVPKVVVTLWRDGGYRTGIQARRAVIFWPTEAALAGRQTGGDGGIYDADPWHEILPHEIAHVLLAARFFGGGFDPGAPTAAYGTPFPDWLDEAVAIWAEPEASRLGRLREARALPEARLDLRSILNATHPGARDPRVMAMRDGGAPPSDEDLWAFYPQAIAVLDFVHHMGGSAAVSELAARLVAAPGAGERALVGLPGLAGDFAGVEAAWRGWLAEGPQ